LNDLELHNDRRPRPTLSLR